MLAFVLRRLVRAVLVMSRRGRLADVTVARHFIDEGNNLLFGGACWLAIFPGATLALIAPSINLFGDWLRDALNPRLR
jgi:hypothetical protein